MKSLEKPKIFPFFSFFLYEEPARKSITMMRLKLIYSVLTVIVDLYDLWIYKVKLNLHFRLIHHLFHPFRLLQFLPASKSTKHFEIKRGTVCGKFWAKEVQRRF